MNDLSGYDTVKHLMRMGDGLGFQGFGLVPWLIQKWSPQLSHFAIVQEFPTWCGSENRRWTSEAIGGGVGPRYLSKVLENYHGHVWWYPLKPEFEDYRKEIGMAATELFGTGYDFQGIFKQVFARVSLNLSRLWCSEYIQACYLKAKLTDILVGLYPSEIPEKIPIFLEPIQIIHYEPEIGDPIPVVTP